MLIDLLMVLVLCGLADSQECVCACARPSRWQAKLNQNEGAKVFTLDGEIATSRMTLTACGDGDGRSMEEVRRGPHPPPPHSYPPRSPLMSQELCGQSLTCCRTHVWGVVLCCAGGAVG